MGAGASLSNAAFKRSMRPLDGTQDECDEHFLKGVCSLELCRVFLPSASAQGAGDTWLKTS